MTYNTTMKTQERKCWRCNTLFPLTKEYWYKDCTDAKYGLQKVCKECSKKRNREYSKEHREYFKNKNDEHYQNNKHLNGERYAKYKDSYLKRIRNTRSTPYGKLYGIYSAARDRARRNKLKFAIDFHFIVSLAEKQEYKCVLTGKQFTYKCNNRKYSPWNPSIDRIDSKKGYTKDNVRLVCTIVNLALNNFGENVFSEMCKAYLANGGLVKLEDTTDLSSVAARR